MIGLLFWHKRVEGIYLNIYCGCTKCVDSCVTEVLPSKQILHVQLGLVLFVSLNSVAFCVIKIKSWEGIMHFAMSNFFIMAFHRPLISQSIIELTIEKRKMCDNLQYFKLTSLLLFFSTINYSAELPLAQGIKFEWSHVYIKRKHSTNMSSVISLFEVLKDIYTVVT